MPRAASTQRVATKTDTKSQQTQYSYDAKKRVRQITKTGDTCQTVTLGYDTNVLLAGFSVNTSGRLATMSYSIRDAIGCEAVQEMYSYTPAGAISKKRLRVVRGGTGLDLDAVYTYDTEGRVASVSYPNGGSTLQNQYDSMGRLSVVREDLIRNGQPSYIAWATGAVYGPAGELKNLSWVVQAGSDLASDVYTNEARTYNSRLQLTGLTASGSFSQAAMNFTYNYSATANNGQITSMANNVSGETVTYAYDALKRLIGASTNTGTWGQSFAYDGFGNMLNQTVTQGTAPSLALAYDNSTNRISTAGYGYDANGNMTASPAFGATYTYDASNRLVTAFSSNGTENYGYAPDNKRVYKKLASGEEQVHFYSGNQRLGIYKFQVDGGGNWSLVTVSTQKYFGGRKLETMDRLGSDVRNTKYFPYGAEPTVTANEKDKFGTYFRDTASNLDYADQRYYSSVIGRFMSPDPYTASGGAGDPASWNRYAYVGGDPINANDPNGLYREEVSGIDDWWGDPFDGLGSNDGNDGWRGSRRLACLSGFCTSTDGSCEISGQRFAPGDPTCVAFFPAAAAAKPGGAKPKCPDNIRNFFNVVIPIATGLAQKWDSSVNDILALSAYESGWLGPHAQELHNLFGLTHAGGNNLTFRTYQESADLWSKNDGVYVKGITDIKAFAAALQPHYNTVNPNWKKTVEDVHSSVLKWRVVCDQ